MKLFTKTLLLLIFTFYCAALLSAQTPPPPPPPAPAKPTKIIGKAKIYEFKTKKSAESIFLNRNDKQIIRATYDLPNDQAAVEPNGVQMIFQSFSDNGFKYKDNHKVSIILDGVDSAQAETKIMMASCNPKKVTECYELLMTPMLPYVGFEAILKAKKIQLKFGETVFDLTQEEIEGLRDLQRTLDK
ncbi:MAG TPA: hypothetical protein VF571_15025 [Pyrinomonadaceae bacterium]|jgi:hypothetical protein